MRPLSLILLAIVLLTSLSCRNKVSKNQQLYDEVMSIHDEVMPKMDNLYRKKMALKEKLANNPDLSDEEKQQTNALIARLDSAGEGMMAWMREFEPIPDSEGEDKAREYLENEMVKIKKVRDDINSILSEASRE